jgi:hypothetical protein
VNGKELVFQFSTCQPEGWLARHIGFPFDPSENIRRATRSPYSHVDFLLPDQSLLGASCSPTAPVLEGNARGVAVRPGGYQKFGVRRRAYVRTDRADAIIALARAQIGKPFDHEALSPRHIFSDNLKHGHRNWRNPDKWYCAELCMWCCEQGGLWPFDLVILKDRVTANDMLCYLNPLMDVVRFMMPIPDIDRFPGEVS